MFAVEHESDWTREAENLEYDVRDAIDALREVVREASAGAVRLDGVRARLNDHGVLELDLPLTSGDAFWINLGDGMTRLLWVAASGPNVEWEWDEETSVAFVAAVVAGRVTCRVRYARRRRSYVLGVPFRWDSYERWYWTDAGGVERAMPRTR